MQKKVIIALSIVSLFAIAGYVSTNQSAEKEFSSTTIQIGMIVSDLDETVKFYKDIIGFKQFDPPSFDVDAEFSKKAGLTDSLPIHVEVLKLGDGPTATQLKVMTFGDRPQQQKNEYFHSNTGIQYITIRVKNLTPFIESIQKHGIKLLGETPVPLGQTNYLVLVKDPDDTFVELIGPMK